MSQVLGMYSAVVAVDKDPMLQGRIRVRCPQILGTALSGWAKPSEPPVSQPNVGDSVWIQFEGGDTSRPVFIWAGTKGAIGTTIPTLDTMPPAAIGGLEVTSMLQVSAEGASSATIIASWPAATENFDTSPLRDLSHYEIRWSYDGINYTGADKTEDTVWTRPGVRAGVSVSVQVRAVDKSGNFGLWATKSTTTTSMTSAGPVPSAPSVSPALGGLKIAWDGRTAAGLTQPNFVSHIEVHAGPTANFTLTAETRIRNWVGNSIDYYATTAYDGGPVYIRLRSVTKLGVPSAATVGLGATPRRAGTDDILANSIVANHIEAGAITATKLESDLVLATQIIAGPPLGTHATMSPDGLIIYADDAIDGIPDPVVKLGTQDDDYFAIADRTGSMLASIDQTGKGSFTGLNVEGSEGKGLIVYGREFTDWVGGSGRGLIAWASSPPDVPSPATTSEIGWFEMTCELEPSRVYQFSTSDIVLQSANSGYGNAHVNIRATVSTTSAPPPPVTLASGLVGQLLAHFPEGRVTSLPVSWNRLYRPRTTETWRFLVSVQAVTASLGAVSFHVGTPSNIQGWINGSYSGAPKLLSGQELRSGGTIVAPLGNYYAAMNSDGNFVLYSGQSPIWNENSGVPGSYVAMQADGNLVLYKPGNGPTWQSGTSGNPGAYLTVQNDGNMVVYNAAGTVALWQSGTGGAAPSTGFWQHPVQLMIRDVGSTQVTDKAVINKSTSGSTSGTPAPKQSYTKDYAATWTATYRADGSRRTNTSDAMQGVYSGSSYKALIGFPTSLVTDLAGASVTKMEVYLYSNHWYNNSGGTAVMGSHNHESQPGSWPNTETQVDRWRQTGWPKPGGRWIDITSWATDVQAGRMKGISIGPAPDANLVYYGRFNGAGTANGPVIRVSYTK